VKAGERMSDTTTAAGSLPALSLVAGGPAYRLQRRLGLIERESPRVGRRVTLAILLTWVPLLVLSALQGVATGHRVELPFLHDFAAYTRFLVAIPLLIIADGIERQMAIVAAHFVRAGLVPPAHHVDYESAVRRSARLLDSGLAEGCLAALAYLGFAVVYTEFPINFSTWYGFAGGSGHRLTLAGWWYAIVGAPLFQFLAWRWLWRLSIWYWFLWRMTRLDLRVIPTHPDRAGGLGFVGEGQRFFWIIVFAVSAAAAGVLANQIVFAGVPLLTFKYAIAGYVLVVLLVFLGPLHMFTPRLATARIESLHNYSALAVDHNQQFDGKWVRGENPRSDPLLGAPEISSLADLGGAYAVLDDMKPIPFRLGDAVALAVAALLPMAPLALTVIPLAEMLRLLPKLLM
jgi:hypothetical protein